MVRSGRPREFDRAEALAQSMRMFWECGYAATSLAELRAAMGSISSASFYAAFASKEALFKEAVSLYLDQHGRYLAPLSDSGLKPRDAIERALRQSVDMQTDRGHPLGCLICLVPSSCQPDAGEVPRFVAGIRSANHAAIRRCVRRGIRLGDLPPDTDTAGLASAFNGFLLGISAQARDGVGRPALRAAVTAVMRLWPASRHAD